MYVFFIYKNLIENFKHINSNIYISGTYLTRYLKKCYFGQVLA